MKIFVPKESGASETRVAMVPEVIKKLVKAGFEVHVESGAGARSFFSDDEMKDAGATVGAAIWGEADIVATVQPPPADKVGALKEGAVLVGFLDPFKNLDLVQTLTSKKVSTLPMELIPRTTLAQKMDALSSQASIAGYMAVLVAATRLPKYFPLLMTAAGTVKPARVVIMGAGVAGLQAIATAKRLGAVVEVSDIREEVKEQVESLGGKFIDLPDMQSSADSGGYAKEVTKDFLAKQQAIVAEHIKQAHVVITTALVPGRPAPKLVTEEMVKSMKAGTVIVDLAVITGGNCVLSKADEDVVVNGVTIIGPSNLPGTMPMDASMLYSRNIQELLLHVLVKEARENGKIEFNLEDEITTGALLTHAGELRNERVADAIKNRSAA